MQLSKQNPGCLRASPISESLGERSFPSTAVHVMLTRLAIVVSNILFHFISERTREREGGNFAPDAQIINNKLNKHKCTQGTIGSMRKLAILWGSSVDA
jgi:hypothetical protein